MSLETLCMGHLYGNEVVCVEQQNIRFQGEKIINIGVMSKDRDAHQELKKIEDFTVCMKQ